ncbi:Hypothetical protein A7982_02291 [Minicystis rosea]|nr:Hypothetical protein A7982_02291 [Minicystis rosea]
MIVAPLCARPRSASFERASITRASQRARYGISRSGAIHRWG